MATFLLPHLDGVLDVKRVWLDIGESLWILAVVSCQSQTSQISTGGVLNGIWSKPHQCFSTHLFVGCI